MKTSIKTLTFICTVIFIAALALAASNVEEGKKLFNDPQLSGSTNDKSCNSCHPNGKGLAGIAGKTEFKTPGGTYKTLPAAINTCITMALKGNALPEDSWKMLDLIAYIESLK